MLSGIHYDLPFTCDELSGVELSCVFRSAVCTGLRNIVCAAMFVLFRGYNNDTFSTWIESILGMFRMSLGAFAEIYETFNDSINDSVYIWVPRVSTSYQSCPASPLLPARVCLEAVQVL